MTEAPIAAGPLDVTVSRLPDGFVSEGLRIAETCNLFGIPLAELSRDELLAAAAQGWQAYNRSLEQSIKNSQMMRELYKASK